MAESKEPYEQKFAGLIEKIEEAKAGGAGTLVVSHPYVLGDDYGELVESLKRLSRADLQLAIAAPEPPDAPPFDPQNN